MIDLSKVYLLFERDEVLVCADNIAIARPISEGDLDPRTGSLQRHIPEGSQTRIDLKVGGWVYVSETSPSTPGSSRPSTRSETTSEQHR